MVLIRGERPSDYEAIDRVVATCFGRPDVTDVPPEVALVRALRGVAGFEPELSLVAEQDEVVIGHLMFSPMTIEGATSTPALALAPLAVLPGHEDARAGTLLMRAGLDVCRERGHRIVIVLGQAKYYRRFGFRPARALGIEPPGPWPDAAFQALGLVPGALEGVRGVARYAAPFDGPGLS